MNTSVLTLLSLILGGGGGRLLDYVPTDMYWADRQIPLSVEALTSQLKIESAPDASDVIAELGAADPNVRDMAADKIVKLGPALLPQVEKAEASPTAEIAQRAHVLVTQLTILGEKNKVRRLMAVRALGELEDPVAIPILRPLTQSKERFVAQYARDALDEIESKADSRPRPQTWRATGTTTPAANDDVWLLPASCRAVGAVRPRGRGPINFKSVEAQLPVRSNQQPKIVVEQIARLAVSVAEKIGDVSIDSLTAGVSGDVGANGGFLVVIATGEFDSQAVVALARSAQVPTRMVDRMEVFEPDGEMAFFIPSDHRLVMLASPAGENYPLQEMIVAVRNSSGGIKTVPEMTRLLQSVDTTQPAWAVVQLTDAYRDLIALQGLNTLTLVGHKTPQGLHLIARGRANDIDAARFAANHVTEMAQTAAAGMKVLEPIVPAIKAASEFLATVRCVVEDKLVTTTAEVKDTAAALFVLPLVAHFGEEEEVIPPPPRPQPVPEFLQR